MSQEQKSALAANVISLPKGGGAVAGMGESFSPDLFTGTGNFSVPIAVPPGRNGLQPSLTLGYSTGSGNGPFGLGWNMGLPGVSRKTNLGIPRYDDTKDVFVLSGAEDLIPVDRGSSTTLGVTHNWIQYRPRTEGLFARIMHHTFSDGQNYWEVRTKDGMVTWYGKPGAQTVENTVVYDPENPRHIASWLIHRTVDPFGNEVVYEYDRDIALTPYPFAQLYLKRIKYADYTHGSETKYLCSVEVNYADRVDAHSEYRQGFEIRTRKRATEVNTYTHPLDVDLPPGYLPSGTNTNSILVKQYKLTYRDELGYSAKNNVSQLAQVQAFGFSRSAAFEELTESLPPVEFEYADFDISKRDLRVLSDDHLPALGLGHPDMDLVDLDGNGLPDFVQMSAGQAIRYWRNKGGGVFDRPRTMKNAPTGLSLGNGAAQLMDADGDGRIDLVMNAPNFAGYYSLNHDGEWDVNSFRKYRTRPPINLKSAQAQFMDLSGDGRTDVLINSNRFECYFQNSPLLESPPGLTPGPSPVERGGLVDENRAIGWSEARFVNKGSDLDEWPNVNFGDPRIRTADLSGDGLQDIVMIQNGNIAYWPNLGYGRFGKRRIMRNSPRLGYDFNPAQLLLGDADGDGQTDVIYVERNQITIWFNQSGNSFSEPIVIKGTPSPGSAPGMTGFSGSIRMVDLFGTGTPGILWSYDLGAAGVRQGTRIAYLDLSGGVKPYVMVGMRNNLGARTRVQYGSSVGHYLRDLNTPHPQPLTPGSSPGQAGEGGNAPDLMSGFVGYAGKWKTTLPFPVQVVDRVEVIDEISKGKLTTRYFYHHGYWDGGEREFRGFGRVDQFDTETFDRYNADNLVLEADPLGSSTPLGVQVEHYAPPVLAKNWFHLGPVGAEKGDWKEVDFSNEYWAGDTNMLQRDPAMLQMIASLPRRARRDAYRTLRGTALRSELYSMDGSPLHDRPYTVSETQTGLRLVASPSTNATIEALRVETHSNHIFFSYGLSSRSTTWERGTDPMTKFSFTGAIDDYGQPLSQISIAVPRGKDARTGGQLVGHSGVYDPVRGYDATIQYTRYMYADPAIPDPLLVEDAVALAFPEQYVVNRAKDARSYEASNDGSMSVFALRDIMLGSLPDAWTGLGLLPEHGPRLLGLSYTYYDGLAFDGLVYGELGAYGVPVRTETLMVQENADVDELTAAYGTAKPPCFDPEATPAPDWSLYPAAFVAQLQDPSCGYVWHDATTEDERFVKGYYTSAQKSKFDFQVDPATAKGLPLAMRDVFDNEATIEYDGYALLPVKVTDPLGMETSSEYDYRILQPDRVTDPNQNVSTFAFTPLGLMHKTALLGKDDASEGDTLDDPGVLLEYDLFAFANDGEPVWVKTTQRQHHINADYLSTLPTAEQNATIVAVEYSDGFGRQLQTRTQAENLLFGDPGSGPGSSPGGMTLGDSGLPADQDLANGPAVGTLGTDNVVVSGAKLYNNKGKVVEQWEPYFSTGFDLTDVDVQHGQRVRIYYDALGRPQRTVNPDATEQRVVYGVPNMLNTPGSFKPSPWERFTYDANDLAPLTHPGNTLSASHHWTPKSELIDALGRTVRTVEYITALPTPGSGAPDIGVDDVVMQYEYDIKGQLIKVFDPLGRKCFEHKYDTAGNNLWTWHLDSGAKTLAVDAQGKMLYSTDAKGAEVYTGYDHLHRMIFIGAKDEAGGAVTLRQYMIYGDSAGLPTPQDLNLKGQLYKHYDEAGKVTMTGYDFKGNPLEKIRRVIADAQLSGTTKYLVNWGGFDESILDAKEYTTGLFYDGLNRVRKSIYPADVTNTRRELVPTYNHAGALQTISFDGPDYVRHIAYNAKGQRVLLAMGNSMMTRYAYDPVNYRLLRIRSEKYTVSSNTYTANGGVQQDLGYLYDLAGNIIGIRDKAPATSGISGAEGPGDLLKQYEYDPLNRLLSATGRESTAPAILPAWDAGIRAQDHTATNTYTRTYEFDKLGNVLQEQHTAVGNASNNFTKVYNYHAMQEHNKLLSFEVGGNTYAHVYDANGNLLTETTSRHHQWGYDDKLKLFKIDAGGGASLWAHYLYDTGGKRIKKVVNKPGGIQEVIVCIDGVFEECYTKNSGAIDTNRYYNTLHVLDGNSRLATNQIGTDVADTTSPLQYTLEDHLGNSTVILDGIGQLINREEYYPFGDSCFGAFAKKRFRYNGKEKDNESGLYNYGARYYSVWTCRFISVDPLADKYAHLNPYNYAGNKPINAVDIDGMQTPTEPPAKAQGDNPLTQSTSSSSIEPIKPLQKIDCHHSQVAETTAASPSSDNLKFPKANSTTENERKKVETWLSSLTDKDIDKLLSGSSKAEEQTLSDDGLEFIKTAEGGFKSEVYNANTGAKAVFDKNQNIVGSGDWTIGYGHKLTKNEIADNTYSSGITEAKGTEILRQDAQSAINKVNKIITVAIDQNQFDAIVSFAYQQGIYNSSLTSVATLVNDGKTAEASEQIRSTGNKLHRREAESNLFMDGSYLPPQYYENENYYKLKFPLDYQRLSNSQ